MSATVAPFPGTRCWSCEAAPGKHLVDGELLCDACLDQLSAAPAPVQASTCDEEHFGPTHQQLVDRLLRGDK
jgi:hypothetical protein